jgi:myo-inositol-1(or 4)-monophosphatase
MNSPIHHGTCARTVAKALLFMETMSSRELTFTEKESPRDLVSAADMAVHNLMCEELEPTGIPVVSEENAASHMLAAQPMAQCWLLDPIDGTANFSARIPLYGVSLALMNGNAFMAGTFGMPATRELFYTVGPEASYLNDARLRPIRKTLATSLVGGCFSSRAKSTQQSRNDEFRLFGMINDRSRGCVRLGSAGVSICYTAAGKLGATYGIAGKVWDVAAALAIAQAAGCRILTAATPDPLATSYVVGQGDVVSEIRAVMRDELGITSWREE